MHTLPRGARWLILAVCALAVVIAVQTLQGLAFAWPVLAAMAVSLLLDHVRVDIRAHREGHGASTTLDCIPVFFILGYFGLPWAILTNVVNSLVFGIVNRSAPYKTAFNIGAMVVSVAAAHGAMKALPMPLWYSVPIGGAVYSAVNLLLLTLAVSLATGLSFRAVWAESKVVFMTMQQVVLTTSGYFLGQMVTTEGWRILLVGLPIPMLYYFYAYYAGLALRHTRELEEQSTELIKTLAAVVDARDAYTYGHSTMVARYSTAIAEAMGYGPEGVTALTRSALLHDIGKVAIPEQVLFKPGSLTAAEYDLMKQHAAIGGEILGQISALRGAALVARTHHERWDGRGYPDGLSGEQIDMDSRIICVADSLDTLISDRPYRAGMTLDQALAEIRRCAGTQFDPQVVAALDQVVEQYGPGFFVNSVTLVRETGGLLHWRPARIDLLTR